MISRSFWRMGLVLSCAAILACGGSEPEPDRDTGGLDSGTDSSGPDVGLPDTNTDPGADPTVDVEPDVDPDVQDADAGERDVPPPPPPTLEEVAQIFSVRCSPCHTDQVSGGLSLFDNAGLHDRLLANSVQLPAMARIAPEDLANSYLWLKLNGLHTDAGGTGETMPITGAVTPDELDTIREWIEAGAPAAQ